MRFFPSRLGRALAATTLVAASLTIFAAAPAFATATITATTGSGATNYPTLASGTSPDVIDTPGVSTCAVPKVAPTATAFPNTFDAYRFVNPATVPVCVTVSIAIATPLRMVAYNGSYDPANETANYLADNGGSGTHPPFSFLAPPNSTYVIVVQAAQSGVPYELTVSTAFPSSTALAAAPATTSCGSSPTPGPVTLTATVTSPTATPAPTFSGTNVTFKDGASTLGTAPVDASGVATLVTGALGAGSHSFTATFNGGNNLLTSTSAPSTVTLTSPPAPSLTKTADGSQLHAVEGASASGITGSFASSPCAVPSDFTVTIDWGDSTSSPGTIVNLQTTPTGVTFDVFGSHVYHEESPAGGYTILTTVKRGASSATAFDTAIITDAPIHATASPTGANDGQAPGQLTGAPGTPSTGGSSGLATFTDDNPFGMKTDFVATIDWGDGKSTSGSIDGPAGPSSGPWKVTGSHQYDCPGTYNVRVVVTDDGGSTDAVITTAVVKPPTNPLDMIFDLIHCA